MRHLTLFTCQGRTAPFRFLPPALQLVTLVTWVSRPVPVAAHAAIERANPAVAAVVAQVPTGVEIWFSEEADADLAAIVVFGPEGARVDLGDTALDLFDPERRHVTGSLRADRTAGEYSVHSRSGSTMADDEAFGSFAFTITTGAPGCEGGVTMAAPVASPVANACVQTPPQGSLATPLLVDGVAVELRAGGAKAGLIDRTVLLTDADGSAITDAEVSIRARHMTMDHGDFPKVASAMAPSRYVAESVGMGKHGAWRVALEVRRAGRPPVTVFVTVDPQGLE